MSDFELPILQPSDCASRLLERATFRNDFFLRNSGLEKVYGVKNHVLIQFCLWRRHFLLFSCIFKMKDSDGNFPKKLPYSSFWKFYFSAYQTRKGNFFQFFWFRNKIFTTLGILYQTFTTSQTFNFVFFSKETEFRSQWCFVFFYPGETDYRCILFAFLKRTIVTKNFFCNKTLN